MLSWSRRANSYAQYNIKHSCLWSCKFKIGMDLAEKDSLKMDISGLTGAYSRKESLVKEEVEWLSWSGNVEIKMSSVVDGPNIN